MVRVCGFEFFVFFVCFIKVQGGFSNERKEIARMAYPTSEKSLQNLTVYLGYANNPFGSSTRLRQKKEQYQPLKSEQLMEEEVLDNKISEGRSKRGVVQLYNMVSCATGCNPLSYKGYGCYCGFLGSGYPVDGIDRCCQDHDWCYNTANCPMYLEYVVPYYWKCYKRRSLCAIDHLELGGSGSCAQRLCECDRILSECLSRYPCPKSRAVCTSSPWRFLQNALMLF